MKFGEKLFQIKLLSRLSHKVCRLLSSPVLLRKFTNDKIGRHQLLEYSVLSYLLWKISKIAVNNLWHHQTPLSRKCLVCTTSQSEKTNTTWAMRWFGTLYKISQIWQTVRAMSDKFWSSSFKLFAYPPCWFSYFLCGRLINKWKESKILAFFIRIWKKCFWACYFGIFL